MSVPPEKAELVAGQQLAERFSAPLRSYFLRRVRDRDNAEDLAQEVLLRAIRAGESEAIERPENYVFTVAANPLKDLRRPRVLETAVEDCEEAAPEGLIDERSPERVMLGEASLAQVL